MQTVRLGVHAFGQSVAQMHFVFEQQPRCWRTRRWCNIWLILWQNTIGWLFMIAVTNVLSLLSLFYLRMVMRMATRTLAIGLILIGIAVARTRCRRIALIVEHNVVRWWWALNATGSLAFQFQVQTTLRVSASDLMRGSWSGKPGRTSLARIWHSAAAHLIVVHHVRSRGGSMHCMGRWMSVPWLLLRIVYVVVASFAHFWRCDWTLDARHRFKHAFKSGRIWNIANDLD